jgi:hypothetical protein
MRKPIFFFFSAILIFAFFACESGQKSADGTDSSSDENTETSDAASAEPEIFIYASKVDKLRLRNEPSQTSEVITTMGEGDFATSTGEVSDNEETVELRGIQWIEPYHKITTFKDKKTGWAFGGALSMIYSGSEANQPDLDKLGKLSAHIRGLDVRKLDSGKKAWDFVKANFADAKGATADGALIFLEQLLFRMETEGDYFTLTEKQTWADEDYEAIFKNKFSMDKYPLTKTLAASGFTLGTGEGMIFPIVDWGAINAFFKGKITAPMQQFATQTQFESENPAFSDAHLAIPEEALIDRAIFWEKFDTANPNFPKPAAQESARWLPLAIINGDVGLGNRDYDTKEINPDVKKTWELVMKKFPDSKLAITVKEIYDLCKAEGWKYTDKVEQWGNKYAEEHGGI